MESVEADEEEMMSSSIDHLVDLPLVRRRDGVLTEGWPYTAQEAAVVLRMQKEKERERERDVDNADGGMTWSDSGNADSDGMVDMDTHYSGKSKSMNTPINTQVDSITTEGSDVSVDSVTGVTGATTPPTTTTTTTGTGTTTGTTTGTGTGTIAIAPKRKKRSHGVRKLLNSRPLNVLTDDVVPQGYGNSQTVVRVGDGDAYSTPIADNDNDKDKDADTDTTQTTNNITKTNSANSINSINSINITNATSFAAITMDKLGVRDVTCS